MTEGNKVFGEKIRYFRNRKHWRQDELADKADLSQSEVSKIENGNFRNLNEETIKKLARAFEIAPEMLVRATPFASLFGQAEAFPFGPIDEGPPFTAYFASALTGLSNEQEEEIKDLDQKVDEICKRYSSYPVVLYRPRLKTSPKDNPDVSPRDVYEIDQERVTSADVVILAAIFPSLGAGMELQLAYQSCSSVILIKKQGQPLSRMVIGCPVRMEIVEYSDLDDLDKKLSAAMDSIFPIFAQFRLSQPQSQNASNDLELGERIRQLRDHRKLSQSDLARMVGVSTASIESLETKPEQVTNPSLKMLRRIAHALMISETYLISGHGIPIHQVNPIFNEHREALRAFSVEVGMSAEDLEEMWKDHVELYQYELSVVGAENRTDIGDKKFWKSKYARHKKDKTKGGKLF
jgi:Predicted transcriptional regulators